MGLRMTDLHAIADQYGIDADELSQFLVQRQDDILLRAKELQNQMEDCLWKYDNGDAPTTLRLVHNETARLRQQHKYEWVIGPFAKMALDELLLVPGNGEAKQNLFQQNQMLKRRNRNLVLLLSVSGVLVLILMAFLVFPAVLSMMLSAAKILFGGLVIFICIAIFFALLPG